VTQRRELKMLLNALQETTDQYYQFCMYIDEKRGQNRKLNAADKYQERKLHSALIDAAVRYYKGENNINGPRHRTFEEIMRFHKKKY
jgi:hypothetical protein